MDDSTYFRLSRGLLECAKARKGDSNDAEIQALWDFVEDVASELGMFIPEAWEEEP